MKKLLLLFMSAGLLISCSDDDSGPDARLDDFWTMTSFAAEMDNLPVLEPNEVIWNIDLDGRKLTVSNLVEEEYPYLLATGTYDISVDDGKLTIDLGDIDDELFYSFHMGQLMLDANAEGMVDAPIMHFEKTNQGGLIID